MTKGKVVTREKLVSSSISRFLEKVFPEKLQRTRISSAEFGENQSITRENVVRGVSKVKVFSITESFEEILILS